MPERSFSPRISPNFNRLTESLMSLINSRKERFSAYFDAMIKDHGCLRALNRNFHQISAEGFPKAYRSNHPSPSFVKKLKHVHGVNTILSIRRADTTGAYLLEKDACEHYGIELVNHTMSSRDMPRVEDILKMKELLETMAYPILIHCKSGADRAGMASVFYKHFIEKVPIIEALAQLSFKFGHIRWADTGKLDFFFEKFLEFAAEHPDVSFLDWVENHYDRDQLNAEFKAEGWANIVVNKLLRRE